MINSLISLLTKSKDTPYAAFLVLCLVALVWSTKALIKEKDEEIRNAQEMEAKVTLVLQEMNQTEKLILIYLERDEHK